jgi:hypothetical protein
MSAQTLAFLTAQLSGGAMVTLLDVSYRGVRLETTRHMRPGQTVCIRFSVDATTFALHAAVVRAAISHLESETVRYETALELVDEASCEQLHVALIEHRRGAAAGQRDGEAATTEFTIAAG